MAQIPEGHERLPGISGLTFIAGEPSGGQIINDASLLHQGYGMVSISNSRLPGSLPVSTTDRDSCPITRGRSGRGYQAGEEYPKPYRTTENEQSIVRSPTNELTVKLDRTEKRRIEDGIRMKMEDLPETEYAGVNFLLYDEKDIVLGSAADIKNTGFSGSGTVNDPRLGPISGNVQCQTCNATIDQCPGHYGNIKLNAPYSPPQFQRLIVKVLNSICISCRRSKLTEADLGRYGFWRYRNPNKPSAGKIWAYNHNDRLRRISVIISKNRSVVCRRNIEQGRSCGDNLIHKYNKDTNKIFATSDPKVKGTEIVLEQIKTVLDDIPDEDAQLLGFDLPAHPRRLIRNGIIVPPLCVRPPMYKDGQQMDDDLTKMLEHIVGKNNDISEMELSSDIPKLRGERKPKKELAPPLSRTYPRILTPEDDKRNALVAALRRDITKLIFGSAKTDERYTSIRKLLQGKKGLVRKFMMGKRGDFSARSVISPGPELEYGEIGLPKSWASILTYPVEVTAENSEACMDLIKAGKVTKIRLGRGEGHQITVNAGEYPKYSLEPGDIIERHMQDGDYVAANRNPSLHRFSMMGYRVRLLEGFTIRMHISSTPQHNADFDGDEMNIFLPRSAAAEAELKTVMNASYCIIGSQDNRPLTGLIFNDLTAAYKLTRDTTDVLESTWQECIQIINEHGYNDQLTTLSERGQKYNLRPRAGKLLFSALLPKDFYYKKGGVIIVEGILVSGEISKTQAGAVHRSIPQFMIIYYSVVRAATFLTVAPFVLKRWLKDDPVTTSLADCYPKKDPETEVEPLFRITNGPELQYANPQFCRQVLENHSRTTHYDTLPRRASKYDVTPDSGEYLISGILPEDFNLTITDPGVRPVDIIKNGVLIRKIRTKKRARDIRDLIIIKLAEDGGNSRAIAFIRDLNTLANRCLGISLKSGKHYQLIEREIERATAILEKYGPDLKDPTKRNRAKQFIIAQLNRVTAVGETTLKENLDLQNNFSLIVSGAKTKGGAAHIGQINATVGLQMKGTEMIATTEGTIYQDPEDMDPRGFGFVASSFLTGLGPAEFFFHAMAGREGLVDTSIKTSEPGDLTRRLVKNLEDVMVRKDASVRMASGHVIQPYYGYTNFNPEELVNVSYPEGDIPFFIDVESLAETLNTQAGFVTVPDEIGLVSGINFAELVG